MKNPAENAQAVQILREENIGRLAMCAGDYPYVIPLCYVYVRQCIYFHCGPAGKKLEMIRENNRVCFQVDRISKILPSDYPCKYSIDSRSVIAFGRVTEVEDDAEKLEALEALTGAFVRESPVNPISPDQAASVIVLKMNIDGMTVKTTGS